MSLATLLRNLAFRRAQRAFAPEPRHDERRCYSPAVEEHLRKAGLIPMPMEDLIGE